MGRSRATMDCRSIGQAINPASGAWFVPKFTSLAQIVPSPVYPYSAELWRKTKQHSFIISAEAPADSIHCTVPSLLQTAVILIVA